MKQLLVVLVAALLLAGCVNIADTAKAAGFGKNAKEQKALDYYTKKYGDPRGSGAPSIIEPIVTTFVTDFMPADKVLKYNKEVAAFHVWFFYDNFGTSDTMTVVFKYLDDGTSIHTFTAQGGGDYGAATFTLQKPDDGWPTGNYAVVISGKAVSETVNFEVIDGPTVAEALPYEGATIPAAASPEASGSQPATTAGMTSDIVVFDTTPGYIGACSLTDTSKFTLATPIQASLLQVWYNWASGESVITYTLNKDGQDFMSGSLVRADCDPYQGNWCNGNQKIDKLFTTGSYELKLTSQKMCLQPGKTGTVRLYGKTTGAAAPSGTGQALSGCSIVGDWKWFNHEHVYIRADGTLDSWDNGAKTEWGTWKKDDSSGYYKLNWNKGWIDELTLSPDCQSLSGKNQNSNSISGTKLSGSVGQTLSGCSIVGVWKWTDYSSVYMYSDGTIKAYNNNALSTTGTWQKQTDGTYLVKWTGSWSGSFKLDESCHKIVGANQYTSDKSATKISDDVNQALPAALPAGVPAHLSSCSYSGNWNTDWGAMVLQQDGAKVTGTYTHDAGKIAGTLVDGVFVGKWTESPTYSEPGDGGDTVFYFTKDCNGFTGSWHYGVHTSGGWSGGWVGTKVS
jgi:hypothetical protein